MALTIRFERTKGGNKGIHLVVDDGCSQNLNLDQDITDDQVMAVEGYDNTHRMHLFYLNKRVTDELISGAPIRLHCPSCRKDYQINSEDYKKAHEIFLMNDKTE